MAVVQDPAAQCLELVLLLKTHELDWWRASIAEPFFNEIPHDWPGGPTTLEHQQRVKAAEDQIREARAAWAREVVHTRGMISQLAPSVIQQAINSGIDPTPFEEMIVAWESQNLLRNDAVIEPAESFLRKIKWRLSPTTSTGFGASRNGKSPRTADSRADNGKKTLPDNQDVRDLIYELQKQRDTGKSHNQIALEFTRGDEKKAGSLLRQARRFRHLYE